MTCKNGKNRNQWKIISDQILFQQLNLYGFNAGRRKFCSALLQKCFQNKKWSN